MAKKKRGLKIRRAKPDDPIFTEGLQIYTPLWARPGYKPPEPKEEPEVEKEQKHGGYPPRRGAKHWTLREGCGNSASR